MNCRAQTFAGCHFIDVRIALDTFVVAEVFGHGQAKVIAWFRLNLYNGHKCPSFDQGEMKESDSVSNFPNNLRYAETHEWVRLEGEMAIVGLSAFAVEQLTDLIVMDLAKAGSKVTAGGRLGEVESVKSVNDIYAPISGEVVEVNAEVVADLSKLSSDPYGAGWLVRIKPENLADVAALMSSTDYAKAVAGADH